MRLRLPGSGDLGASGDTVPGGPCPFKNGGEVGQLPKNKGMPGPASPKLLGDDSVTR